MGAGAGGRFSAKGATARHLIALAYGMQEDRILGGLKWIDRDRWTIEAKAEHFPGMFNRERLLQAMKAMLADLSSYGFQGWAGSSNRLHCSHPSCAPGAVLWMARV
jgi:hypothetical protein